MEVDTSIGPTESSILSTCTPVGFIVDDRSHSFLLLTSKLQKPKVIFKGLAFSNKELGQQAPKVGASRLHPECHSAYYRVLIVNNSSRVDIPVIKQEIHRPEELPFC